MAATADDPAITAFYADIGIGPDAGKEVVIQLAAETSHLSCESTWLMVCWTLG